jgi:hypothetical protein
VKRLYYAAFSSLLVVIFLFFQGCGDTNVFEGMSDDGGEAARTEQARQDLNSGNFEAVIEALKNRTNLTEQETRYLASAYMGEAGFDTLKLLSEFAKNDDTGKDVESFDVITRIFAEDESGKITSAQLNSKMYLIDQALKTLGATNRGRNARFSNAFDGSSPSDDVKLQRGICAAIHAIFTICQTVACEYNIFGNEYVPLTIKAFHEYFPNAIVLSGHCQFSDNYMITLNSDLGLVQEAVEALSSGNLDKHLGETPYQGSNENDIHREFNTFLEDIKYSGGDTPNEVTPGELSEYLNQLLSKQ